jgi:hypothetical protein
MSLYLMPSFYAHVLNSLLLVFAVIVLYNLSSRTLQIIGIDFIIHSCN